MTKSGRIQELFAIIGSVGVGKPPFEMHFWETDYEWNVVNLAACL